MFHLRKVFVSIFVFVLVSLCAVPPRPHRADGRRCIIRPPWVTRDERQTMLMAFRGLVWRAGGAASVAAVFAVLVLAQSDSTPVQPLRTAPTEKFTVNPGFRDWAPTTIAGTTILGGNSSNKGGLFAVDMLTGKVKWSSRPTGTVHGNPFVATAPAVSGDVVITPMGHTLVAVSLATGKEVWRGPVTEQGATVAVSSGLAYVMGEDTTFYALDASTGREKWKVAFARSGSCDSVPIVRDGTVYLSGSVIVTPADANRPASKYWHLFALDATTGRERWRSPSAPLGGTGGVCLSHPIVTADTFYGLEGSTAPRCGPGDRTRTLEACRSSPASRRAGASSRVAQSGRRGFRSGGPHLNEPHCLRQSLGSDGVEGSRSIP